MSAGRFAAYGPGPTYAGTGTGSRRAPESTTSYDSRSEAEGVTAPRGGGSKVRDAYGGEGTVSSRDTTRDTSYYSQGGGGGGEVHYVPRKKEEEAGGRNTSLDEGGSTTDTEGPHHGSYNVQYPAAFDEKVEWSCDEAGGWQKLSFLFLVLAFLGHAVAVCTPYWVVAYLGDQMSVYEGVWLSCYREQGIGRWVCSNYDTIRKVFEQPPWYEASQICAVLSVILLLPALVAASLYSYVVALSGRSRASWVLVCFLGGSAFCAFLSFVIFGAGYPLDQDFPPGDARLHGSFGLQIISFLFGCLSLATHLKDSSTALRVWDNNKDESGSGTVVRSVASRNTAAAPSRGPYVTSGRVGDVKPRQSNVPKLPSFSMPKFPAALSRFRSGGEEKSPSAPPLASSDYPEVGGRETKSAEKVQQQQQQQSSVPSQRFGGNGRGKPSTTYRSYAPSSGGGSVSGHDSVV